MKTIEQLRWKKYPVLNDGFICLVDAMGDDSSIVQAARVSYGKDEREISCDDHAYLGPDPCPECEKAEHPELTTANKDRKLLRLLLRHGHTTPFEMVEIKFLVRVPMDCWRQWIRHRTANVNEYSTRYSEAIDSQQTTPPEEWRLQATDNKQGSSGFLSDWKETETNKVELDHWHSQGLTITSPGHLLTDKEKHFQLVSRDIYEERIRYGVAKEQARKDLPLSTYTEAYWKCDLHNIFNFLRLRMDSHAQYEIRMYANAMAEIVKQIVPVAWEAFEDYVLHAKKFSRMEMQIIKTFLTSERGANKFNMKQIANGNNLTDREWKEFLEKLQ